MAQGQFVAEALVLHPFESVAALWRVCTDWPDSSGLNPGPLTCDAVTAQVNQLDADLHQVMHALLDAHRGFDLGDEGILAESGAVTNHGKSVRFRVEQMEYAAVIIPSMVTIAPSTLALLQEFAALGGPVLRCGATPALLDGEPSAELDAFMATLPQVAPDALAQVLAQYVAPVVRVAASGSDTPLLRSHVRRLPSGDLLMLIVNFNRLGERAEVTVEISGHWRSVYRMNTSNGQQEALEVTPVDEGIRLEMSLAPVQYHLLRVSSQAATGVATGSLMPLASSQSRIEIPAAAWTVERLDDNALILDCASWKEASFADFTPQSIPVLSIRQRLNALDYRGPLSLCYSFDVRGLAPNRKVHLIVERPEQQRISVNGVPVAYAGRLCRTAVLPRFSLAAH